VLVGSIAIMLTFFGLYSYFTVRFYNDKLMDQVLSSANRMSDVIKQSTHYSMLLNRREDVYHIITMIGKEPGVEGIRIYNKRGEIMFSTDKQEEHTAIDMHAEACYVCHEQEKPLSSLPMSNRTRIFESGNSHRVLGVINPIRNEPSCSDAECHAHPPERTVLGVLDVRMSLKNLDATVHQAQNTMAVYAIAAILVVGIIVVLFLSSTVLTPTRRLMAGAQQISSGNLSYHISVNARNELGKLAEAFNEMTRSLKGEKEQNQRWADTLQQRVREKTDELNAIHKQIVHIEKMASLGKLAATIAHEINNPLEAILTYAKLIARRIRKDETQVTTNRQTLEDIELIARETDRCGNIVKNLLLFSKKQTGEFAIASLKSIIDHASQLVQHHCRISNVELRIQLPEGDISLMCNENQLNQALVALFVNAVEAMPGGGTIRVEAKSASHNNVLLTISDTGMGISEADLPFIFEPFFTTKKDGRGVGLGLSVVYGILERHGGSISVVSAVGKGTTFTLSFPRVPHELPHAAENAHQ
jgi:two-component system NtrC family sensor kinase